MRLLFRLVGLLMLAGAFAALIIDGTRSVASGALDFLPLGRLLAALSPQQFQKARALIETKLPMVWDPVLVTIFLLPTWLVLGAVGLVVFTLGRRRPPRIGYVRR